MSFLVLQLRIALDNDTKNAKLLTKLIAGNVVAFCLTLMHFVLKFCVENVTI